MALQFMDGFDHYYLTNDVGFTGAAACTLQKWDSSTLGQMYPVIGSGRFGGQALQIKQSGGGGILTKNVPTPKDELVLGFACKSITSHTVFAAFNYDSVENIELRLEYSTGNVVVLNTDGSVNTTVASVLSLNVWNYFEFKVKVHATTGTVEVRMDEVAIVNLSGHDTGTTGDLIDTFTLAAANNLQFAYVDDLYLLDTTGATNNDFLGGCRISTLNTTANGATNDFTLTDDGEQGNYTIVTNADAVRNEADLTIGRDHNYVESGIVGAREDYDNTAFTEVTPAVFGVQVVNNTRSTSTGVIRYLDEMTVGGVQYDNGTEVTATNGDYSMSTYIRDTDPSDNAAWTVPKVNAVGSGFSITYREI